MLSLEVLKEKMFTRTTTTRIISQTKKRELRYVYMLTGVKLPIELKHGKEWRPIAHIQFEEVASEKQSIYYA